MTAPARRGPGAKAPAAARIPAFVNAKAGSADKSLEALRDDPAFEVHETKPEDLTGAITAAVRGGAERILICGGDGTIASAAATVAGTSASLALLPGGTLNHFAKHLGIPTEPKDALLVAATGIARRVDVGYVNDHLFLNTSSVGAYVTFVHARERMERWLGYHLASAAASIRVLWRLPRFRVELEAEGEARHYVTPMVFVGVGERKLTLGALGARAEDGRRGLHVIVVRGRTRSSLMALALEAASHRLRVWSYSPHADNVIVEQASIEMPRPMGNVAVDGETVPMRAPLAYRIARDALSVIVPATPAKQPP